jgi:hypothetical protein
MMAPIPANHRTSTSGSCARENDEGSRISNEEGEEEEREEGEPQNEHQRILRPRKSRESKGRQKITESESSSETRILRRRKSREHKGPLTLDPRP